MEYYKGISNNELDFYVLIWKKKYQGTVKFKKNIRDPKATEK